MTRWPMGSLKGILAEQQVDEMANLKNRKLMKWQVVKTSWQDGKLAKQQVDEMKNW